MTLFEKTDHRKALSPIYHNVANAYFNLYQFQKSADYCFKSLDAHKKYGGNSYLGRVYSTLGQSYYEQFKERNIASLLTTVARLQFI